MINFRRSRVPDNRILLQFIYEYIQQVVSVRYGLKAFTKFDYFTSFLNIGLLSILVEDAEWRRFSLTSNRAESN